MAKTLFYCARTGSLAAQIVLEWTKKPYELCKVPYAELHDPLYLSVHPRGKVPALRVGDRVIHENVAILLYLARRAPDARLIADAGSEEGDEQMAWVSFFATDLMMSFLVQFGAARWVEEKARPSLIEHGRAQVRKNLAYVEAQLGERTTVVGEHRSIADAMLFTQLRWADEYIDFETEFPNLHRFRTTMSEDTGVQFALKIESGEFDDSVFSRKGLRNHHVAQELLAPPPVVEDVVVEAAELSEPQAEAEVAANAETELADVAPEASTESE